MSRRKRATNPKVIQRTDRRMDFTGLKKWFMPMEDADRTTVKTPWALKELKRRRRRGQLAKQSRVRNQK